MWVVCVMFSVLCTDLQGSLCKEVSVAAEIWRPMTIEVGAFGSLSGISKIVASVINPLADNGVSVFCLSSNQEDYVMVSIL